MFIIINCNTDTTFNKQKTHKELTDTILAGFDFNSEDYELYLVRVFGQELEEGLHYYSDDKALLSELKKQWVIRDSNCNEKLWYDHILYLVKNDSVKLKIGIGSKTNELYVNDLRRKYCFDSQKYLFYYSERFQKIYCKKYEFKNIKERDDIMSNIDTNNLIANHLYNTRSLKYKFVKRFKYSFKFHIKEYSTSKFLFDDIRIDLYNRIEKKYKCSDFFLDSNYGDYNGNHEEGVASYTVDIYCNKDLYNKFDLYECVENYDEQPLRVTIFSTVPL